MAHPCFSAKETLAEDSASFEIKSNKLVHMEVIPCIAGKPHFASSPASDNGHIDAQLKVSDEVLEDVSINRMPLTYGTQMPIHLDCSETRTSTVQILQHQTTDENVYPVLDHTQKGILEPDLHKMIESKDETLGYIVTQSRDCTEQISDVPYCQMSVCQASSSSNTSTSMHYSVASCSFEKHGSSKAIAEHELIEGTWGLVQCPFCTNMYNDPTELLEHQKSHTQEEQFECIDHEVVLAECQEVPGDAKIYQCIVCDRSFSKQSSLMTHLRIHTGEKPYSCHLCQKTFNQRTSLTVHLRTHTGEMPYPCNECSRSFRQKSNLTHHMKSHIPQGIIRYLNGFEGFNHNMDLQVQHSDVSGNPQWHNPRTTGLVDQSTCFKRNPDTKKSLNPLSRGKLTVLEASVKPPFDLASHLEIPKSKRPYTCSSCFKRFTHESNLIVHQRIHTGDRTYRCHECGKEFSRRTSLMVHIRTHTGEMPYQCRQCKRSFRQQSNLIYHLKTNSVQGVLSCSESSAAPTPQNCRGIAPKLTVNTQYPGDLNNSLHANFKARSTEVLVGRESPAASKPLENLHNSSPNVSIKPEPSDIFNNLPHAQFTSKPPQVPLTCPSNVNFKAEPCDHKFNVQAHVNFKSKPSQDIPVSAPRVDFPASESMSLNSAIIDLTASPCQMMAMSPSLVDIHLKPDSLLFGPSPVNFNSKLSEGQLSNSSLDVTSKSSLEPPICASSFNTKPKSSKEVHFSSSQLDFTSDTTENVQSVNVVPQTSEKPLISPSHVDIKSEPSEQQLINSSYIDNGMSQNHLIHSLEVAIKPEPADESLISPSSLEYKPNGAENICYRPLSVDIKPEPCDELVIDSSSEFKSQHQANLFSPLQDSSVSFFQPGVCYSKQPLPIAPPQARKRGRPRKCVKSAVQDGLSSFLTSCDPPVVIYKCERCSKHFTHQSHLLSHHCTHLPEKKHQCQVCWKRFGHRTSLMVHMRTHTGEMPYECKQCGRRFRQQSNLLYHLKSHSSPSYRVQRTESFGHGIVNRACRTEPAREQLNGCLSIAKVQVYMDGRTYNNTVIEKATAPQLDAQLYQRTQKRGRPRKYFKFKPCPIPNSNVLSRQRVPMTKRPYRCRRCPKRFNHKSNLVVHQRIHTGELPYHCDHCNRSFRQQSNLSHHLKSHNLSVEDVFSDVNECGALENYKNTFNGVVSLVKEDLISPQGIDITTGLYVGRDGESDTRIGHLSEQSCVVEELVPSNGMLEEDPVYQESKSTEHRSFKCNECFKSFNHISNLIVHQRIHTGDKTYRCHECSKHFSQRTSLMVHLRTHTGEMPYQCIQCKRSFRQQSNLIYHLKSRTVQGRLMCKEGEEVHSHAGGGRSAQKPDKAEMSEEAPVGPIHSETKMRSDAPARNEPSMHIEVRQTRARVRLHEVSKILEENSDSVSKSTLHEVSKILEENSDSVSKSTLHEVGKILEENSDSISKSVCPTESAMYKCSECCKTFTHESNLIVHQRIHSGDRSYQCIHCNKEFSQRTSLMVHLRTHTGEMPYSCQQCGKSFRQQSNLIYHMKSHKISSSGNSDGIASYNSDQSSFVNSDLSLPLDLKNMVPSEDMKKQELHGLHLPHRRPRGRPRKHVKLKASYGVHRKELQCQ